ncbi:hypothetical protein UUU_27880 [Klebsiella pneumoniae subsp. pneumoniae DSM 30104 = JCM 1662 = NBRC 14940]|nr:hypothetical protein UUU_27880 [Klebsiella pneumoniae subsp. pneumoniae DSM 30104 = JCM 1662 = NBRC 14940]
MDLLLTINSLACCSYSALLDLYLLSQQVNQINTLNCTSSLYS